MSDCDAESDDATAHAAAFQRDGFCVVPSLIPAAEAADARARSTQLWTTRHAAAEWLMAAHQLNQPSPQAWIRDIALAPRVGRLVSAMLGGRRPALLSSQLFVKPPSAGAAADDDGRVPWHQDGAAGAPAGSIAVWLALEAVGPRNGALRVLPGLHTRGRLPLAAAPPAVRHFEEQIDAAALAPHLDRAVAYELEPGGAGVHGPWAPHCSGPNRSGVDRHVLVLRYVDAAAQARRGELLWRVVPRGGESVEVPWDAEPPSDGDGEEAREPKRRRRAEPGALAEYVCWSTGERIDRHCYVLEYGRGVS